ncbi:MAG: transporter substrate-binding domain-containing protein, partial [Roseinatronobacter sp.]|nr:transporter substrate-binding domain-containing protein [Roseinatronobacter sp.]
MALVLIGALLLCATLPARDTAAQNVEALQPSLPNDQSGRLGRILQRGRLIVGVKDDYPPWGMRDDAGEIIGFEIDLAADIADRLGVSLELIAVSAANRLPRLEQGVVDLVI